MLVVLINKMAIYNLEEDPNIYITPTRYGNRFVYRMANFVKGSYTRKVIRDIDLRNNKLMIHGTEIKETILRKLYESLTLGVGQKMGHIYVNCNGACFFFVSGKGICRPIHNVIFDWSMFEVIVPNSLTDSLRKKLEEKEKEIEQNVQISSAKNEALSAMASLEDADKNIKELENQLSSCIKENEDMIKELRKLQDELSFTKDELKSTKVMVLESSTKEVNEVKDIPQNTEVELIHKVSDHLHSVSSKVKSTNQKLDQVLVSQLWNNNNNENNLPVFLAIEDVDD